MSDLLTIPWQRLSADALAEIIADFVTREGTDYGPQEHSFEVKCAQVRRQIEAGTVLIAFDAETESLNLLRADALDLSES